MVFSYVLRWGRRKYGNRSRQICKNLHILTNPAPSVPHCRRHIHTGYIRGRAYMTSLISYPLLSSARIIGKRQFDNTAPRSRVAQPSRFLSPVYVVSPPRLHRRRAVPSPRARLPVYDIREGPALKGSRGRDDGDASQGCGYGAGARYCVVARGR